MIEKLEGYKKLLAAILSSIIALVAFMNGLDAATVGVIVGPLAGYIIAQGAADWGKEAAKVHAKQPVVITELHKPE
jgi:hypothetical protein